MACVPNNQTFEWNVGRTGQTSSKGDIETHAKIVKHDIGDEMTYRLGIAAALLMVSSVASAVSSVTLYGILSEGIAYVSNEGGANNYKLLTGTLQNNRFGFKIDEDLGGGTSARAVLENGFDITTGKFQQGGRMFGRQAWVGLSNLSYGSVFAGRQYDMLYDYLSPFAAPSASNGLAAHPGDSDNLMGSWRYSNSIKYVSPSMGGFSLEALYAFSNLADGFSFNRAFSAGMGYNKGPIQLAAAFTQIDRPGTGNPNGAVSDDYAGAPFFLYRTSPLNPAVGVERQRNFGFGGSYRVTDRLRFSALIDNVHYFYLDGTSLNLNNVDASLTYNLSPGLVLGTSYVYSQGKYGGLDANPHWNTIQCSVDYFLSARTDVYIYGDFQRETGPHAVADIYLNAPSTSGVQTMVVAGIRHRF